MRLLPFVALFSALASAVASDGPVPLGQKLDSVAVQDLNGAAMKVSLEGRVTVVVFVSTTCPISNDYNDRMSSIYRDYTAMAVQFVFVNANANESRASVREHAQAAGFPFPVYKDGSNVLADHLGATVTPEAFVFDREGVLRYKGQIEDSRNPARTQVRGLRTALDELLSAKPVSRAETKAFGCTIKRVRKIS